MLNVFDGMQQRKNHTQTIYVFSDVLHFIEVMQNINKATETIFAKWKEFQKLKCTSATFSGVDLIDIHKLENFFEVNINVYEICSLGTITNLYHSSANYGTTMNLNLHFNHFSYITDINYFCGRHQCQKCNRFV